MNILELLDRPIAFQRSFVRLTGSINAALMLSQAVYWSTRSTLPNGWFYKTRDEWEEETGLSRYEQEGARKILIAKRLLAEVKRGVPCKVHYQVNAEELAIQLGENQPTGRGNTPHLVGGKPANKLRENHPTITETTAEITSETTSEINSKGVSVDELCDRFANEYPRKLDGESIAERRLYFSREVAKIAKKNASTREAAATWLVSRMTSYANSLYVRTADPHFLPYARNWLMNKKYDSADRAWSHAARKTLGFGDFIAERDQLSRIM